MTRRSLGLMLPPVLMFAVAAATGGPAGGSAFGAAATAVSRSAPIRDGATALISRAVTRNRETTACGTRTTAVPTSARLRSRGASSGARTTPARGMQTTRDRISAATQRTVEEGWRQLLRVERGRRRSGSVQPTAGEVNLRTFQSNAVADALKSRQAQFR